MRYGLLFLTLLCSMAGCRIGGDLLGEAQGVPTIAPAASNIIGATSSSSIQFAVTGGYSPYTYSVTGLGSITSDGTYTGGDDIESVEITVTDSQGQTASTNAISLGAPVFHVQASDIDGNGDGNSGWNDGDRVSSWDSINSSMRANQTDNDRRPVYRSSDPEFGDYPVIEFTRVGTNGVDNQCMSFTTDISDAAQFSFFAASKTSGVGTEIIFYNRDLAGTSFFAMGAFNAALGAAIGNPSFAHSPSVGLNTSDVPFAAGAMYFFSNSGTTSSSSAIVHHSLVSATAGTGTSSELDVSTGDTPILGSEAANCGTNPLEGVVAEAMFYNAPLLQSHADAVNCYLATKYGLESTEVCED